MEQRPRSQREGIRGRLRSVTMYFCHAYVYVSHICIILIDVLQVIVQALKFKLHWGRFPTCLVT